MLRQPWDLVLTPLPFPIPPPKKKKFSPVVSPVFWRFLFVFSFLVLFLYFFLRFFFYNPTLIIPQPFDRRLIRFGRYQEGGWGNIFVWFGLYCTFLSSLRFAGNRARSGRVNSSATQPCAAATVYTVSSHIKTAQLSDTTTRGQLKALQ